MVPQQPGQHQAVVPPAEQFEQIHQQFVRQCHPDYKPAELKNEKSFFDYLTEFSEKHAVGMEADSHGNQG